MSNLEQVAATLSQQISQAQKHLEQIKRAQGSKRGELANRYQKQNKRVKNLLDTYQFTIQNELDNPSVLSHQNQYKQFKNRLNKVQDGIEYSRNANIKQEDLFKHRKAQDKNPNNRQQVIQLGDRVLDQGIGKMKNIVKDVEGMKNTADNINIELDRQINQLDKIYDDMKDTETTLKRAEKHLKYFARQVYTDKLLICLIIFIVIAIIVIIILNIVGKVPAVQIDGLK